MWWCCLNAWDSKLKFSKRRECLTFPLFWKYPVKVSLQQLSRSLKTVNSRVPRERKKLDQNPPGAESEINHGPGWILHPISINGSIKHHTDTWRGADAVQKNGTVASEQTNKRGSIPGRPAAPRCRSHDRQLFKMRFNVPNLECLQTFSSPWRKYKYYQRRRRGRDRSRMCQDDGCYVKGWPAVVIRSLVRFLRMWWRFFPFSARRSFDGTDTPTARSGFLIREGCEFLINYRDTVTRRSSLTSSTFSQHYAHDV